MLLCMCVRNCVYCCSSLSEIANLAGFIVDAAAYNLLSTITMCFARNTVIIIRSAVRPAHRQTAEWCVFSAEEAAARPVGARWQRRRPRRRRRGRPQHHHRQRQHRWATCDSQITNHGWLRCHCKRQIFERYCLVERVKYFIPG